MAVAGSARMLCPTAQASHSREVRTIAASYAKVKSAMFLLVSGLPATHGIPLRPGPDLAAVGSA
jgi:hypothetical protein